MNKALAILLLVFSCVGIASAEAGKPLKKADVDIFDLESVRRGAGYFSQYCLGCHGIKQIRYSRIAKDLKLDADMMQREIMFGDTKIHDYAKTAMAPTDAEMAFGVVPPDLSLIVRARGADWVYSYLKGFYADPKRPFGVNNVVAENVAMPNVLWELQGTQIPVVVNVHGQDTVVDVKRGDDGKLSAKEFNKVATDLTNFLAYVSEPAKLERLPLGKYVIAFLIFLTFILYKLKKEYWKDVH
ncbi:ubiquinol-cytochrome c reductase cytochrome c1 subunit [Methylomagnum ishizawai]|uniref:Ubiquinol-cytochrome c reductase cytochrome c1 subunit n=1 Tax=Methylomagnum ishizawai TaxID=1760988 RepID=A0A1Y6CVU6_9GAMM|nr:cytochrome c1 [Methylomagnum ishizawai]SMF94768.1 ubiquinol-cytochrome c reductase cytochrome c1 subunit [Methylomagnum ishizawai]